MSPPRGCRAARMVIYLGVRSRSRAPHYSPRAELLVKKIFHLAEEACVANAAGYHCAAVFGGSEKSYATVRDS